MTQVLFSTQPESELHSQLDRLAALPPLQPFSAELMDFATNFARRILKLPNVREFPELATLAHWFRPAAIGQLANQVLTNASGITLARGMVFHLAPSNVDVLFAYTWLMSVLSGNTNVARLSQKNAPQRDALISILDEMQRAGEGQPVLERTLFITYPHNAKITGEISKRSHCRIIWGGDNTVATIRAIPLAPLAVEMAFPDRFGVAAFSAVSILSLGDDELDQVARRFCNDMLWFGQQACSSPRSLFWIGSEAEFKLAKKRFWAAVSEVATSGFPDEPANLMARVTDAHLLAALGEGIRSDGPISAYPLHLNADSTSAAQREVQTGFGLIVESRVERLDEIATSIDDRDQTLVQHGFEKAEIIQFLHSLQNRGIDRVVPIGRALDFDSIWDGTDLFRLLTRITTL